MITLWPFTFAGNCTRGQIVVVETEDKEVSAMADTLELFQSIGLSEAKAKDTAKNVAVSNSLKSLILEVKIDDTMSSFIQVAQQTHAGGFSVLPPAYKLVLKQFS